MILWQSLKKSDFKNFKNKIKNDYFSIHFAKDAQRTTPGIGFRLSKKHLKNAVARNVCKRSLREFCRLNSLPFNKIILSTLQKIPLNNKNLKKELKQLLCRLNQEYF